MKKQSTKLLSNMFDKKLGGVILTIFFTLAATLNATEVYKSRVAAANKFKNYSMCRSNNNDGFIYCGTIKNTSGVDKLHILKTDNNFNTIWSYMYELGSTHKLNFTKVAATPNNEYWISGYAGTTTSVAMDKKPFIMKIDNNGIVEYDLNLLSSEQGECNPLERTLEFAGGALINDPPLDIPAGICNFTSGLDIRTALSLNDNSCN